MLVELKIDAGSLKLLDRVEQVNERTTEPVNRPGHHNIELAPLGKNDLRAALISMGFPKSFREGFSGYRRN
ncbi:MAG TPA: hypothetical protein VGU90_08100, partial [Terriglobales bacterium]|nr:hypothetical protein [Terriglobales bacterium]